MYNNKVILKHSDITYVGIDTPYNMFTFTIYYITKKEITINLVISFLDVFIMLCLYIL
ncbi:hypothetical protein CNEO4_210042 [Clostridium neonatale]|nr:hypothetical protein CNEO4_210042 [Clostridium neonatale]